VRGESGGRGESPGEPSRRSPAPGPSRRGRLFDLPVAEDIRKEMAFHLEMKVEALVEAGWTREAARAEAERLFGDAARFEAESRLIAERQRRAAGRRMRAGSLGQDIRFGARMLLRRPGFTVVAVLTLALGIGANSAVYDVIENVLLAPLPYPAQDRIVKLWEVTAGGSDNPVAEPNYFEWRAQSRSFAAMAAVRGPAETPILGGGEAVRRPVTLVSGEFFEVMGGVAVKGRLPRPDEVVPGAPPVAVISHRFWSTVLGSEPDLSKLSVSAYGMSAPITAVLPAQFDYPSNTDVWVVLYPDAGGTRTSHNYEVIARLSDGVSLASAQREMETISGRLAQSFAGEIDAVSVHVIRLAEDMFGSYRRPLILLLCAAGAVLLVACTNLASSLLARASTREREVAVRVAVGAGRLRVVRQFLTESLLLAVLASAIGLALAIGLLHILQGLEPSGILRLRGLGVGTTTLAFTLLTAFAATLLFGVVPALRSSRVNATSLLRSGGRGESNRRGRFWNGLVVVEVAMAFVLLITSGLLIRSFRAMVGVEQGFDAKNVVGVDIFVPRETAANDTALALLESRLIDGMRALPGVAATGLVSMLPGTGRLNGGADIEGSETEANAEYRVADEGYFEAMRIPLRRGRMFDATDQPGTEPVVLVDEAFVARFLPGPSAVGRRVRNLRNDSFHYDGDEWLTIVGVVGSIRPHSQVRGADPTIYVLARQRPFRSRDAVLTLRMRAPTPAITSAVRAVMAERAPGVPWEIDDIESRIAAPLAGRRFAMIVVAGFGMLTLMLAGVGIHGVVNGSVERRTREMGIRIALGAEPHGVARRIVRDAMGVVAVGIAVGLAGALAASRLLGGFLVSTPPTEPLTFATVTAILALVALIACMLPARRITRIDPIMALRAD
jgi:putative ABC transport system permease protein